MISINHQEWDELIPQASPNQYAGKPFQWLLAAFCALQIPGQWILLSYFSLQWYRALGKISPLFDTDLLCKNCSNPLLINIYN